jgi:hypothetical protein
MFLDHLLINASYSNADYLAAATRAATRRFESMHLKAFWSQICSRLKRKPSHLLSLEDALEGRHIRGEHYLGLHEVPIARIRGSEGRSRDFNADWEPLHEHTRQKWVNVAVAYGADVALSPVEIIQVGESYFVRDGHHRISVAKARGKTHIEAKVTRIEIA